MVPLGNIRPNSPKGLIFSEVLSLHWLKIGGILDFGKTHELNIGSQLIAICIRKMRDILRSDLIQLSHNSIDFRCIPLFKIVLI